MTDTPHTPKDGATVGSRCRMSELGKSHMLMTRDRYIEGEFLGFTRVAGLAKVRWDGYKTVLQFHPDFIEVFGTARHTPAPSRAATLASNRAEQEEILKNQRLIRRAFDLVRYDPAEKLVVGTLAKALGGRLPITPSILDTARQIVKARGDSQ